MSVDIPSPFDRVCPSLRHLAQHGDRDWHQPVDNLGMALRSLAVGEHALPRLEFLIVEASLGPAVPTVIAAVDYITRHQESLRGLRGVIFYTLADLRLSIWKSVPLPIYFTATDVRTLRFIPCQRTAHDVAGALVRWGLVIEWSGKAGDHADLCIDSVVAPD